MSLVVAAQPKRPQALAFSRLGCYLIFAARELRRHPSQVGYSTSVPARHNETKKGYPPFYEEFGILILVEVSNHWIQSVAYTKVTPFTFLHSFFSHHRDDTSSSSSSTAATKKVA
jgi:hypothetical protein